MCWCLRIKSASVFFEAVVVAFEAVAFAVAIAFEAVAFAVAIAFEAVAFAVAIAFEAVAFAVAIAFEAIAFAVAIAFEAIAFAVAIVVFAFVGPACRISTPFQNSTRCGDVERRGDHLREQSVCVRHYNSPMVAHHLQKVPKPAVQREQVPRLVHRLDAVARDAEPPAILRHIWTPEAKRVRVVHVHHKQVK